MRGIVYQELGTDNRLRWMFRVGLPLAPRMLAGPFDNRAEAIQFGKLWSDEIVVLEGGKWVTTSSA